MGARWTIPADPDRLERAAQDHEIVANEYEGRARFFRDKAADLRAEARELRDTKPPVVGRQGKWPLRRRGLSSPR
jgi:hypothetical protein